MGTNTFEKKEMKGSKFEAAPGVFCLSTLLVNILFIDGPNQAKHEWILVDTGTINSTDNIIRIAEKRYGTNSELKAIILTHGHFDHIGAITEIVKHWDVPVYAHELEIPYLTGRSDYPPPDPTVGGGLMSRISPLYPNKSINLGNRVSKLPADGSIPFMPGWNWIHTPGHTNGHISLFRKRDGVLIAGDALTTVKQESALAVLTQKKKLHGPPAYFTTDWQAAWESINRLRDLNPNIIISSHGLPLKGQLLQYELEELSENFDNKEIPNHGRYVPKQ